MSLRGLTRRDLLRAGAAAGALAGIETLAAPSKVLERVLAAPAACGALNEIEHVVIFINENRSFDSYFGTYRGVRGFGDRSALKLRRRQRQVDLRPAVPGRRRRTLRRPPAAVSLRHEATAASASTTSPTSGRRMHECWNGGAMDRFLSAHLEAERPARRAQHDGLLHARRPALLPRAGRRLHDLRPLPLLGDRPDRPQPPVHDERDDRSRRQERRAVAADARHEPRRRSSASSPGRTYPEQLQARGHQLEGLLDARRRLRRQRPPVLQGLPGRPAAGRQRVRAAVPGRLPGRLRRRARCRRSPGCCARWCRASIRPRPSPTARSRSPKSWTRSTANPARVGEDGAVRHLRRERRLLRPRAAAGARRRERPASTSPSTRCRASPAASAGRSGWASACRCSSSRRSRAAASCARRPSITPRCCASWRRASGPRCRT